MNPYQALIFDLDGTLLNTLDDLANSTNYALGVMGYPLRTMAEIRSFVGNGMAKLVARSVPEGTSQEATDQCLAIFRAHYDAAGHPNTAPYPGILEMLHQVKTKGYSMGVVSNKMNGPVQDLCAKHFPSLFDVAIGELPGLARKPAPDLVHLCLDRLSASNSSAVYIGDSEVDLQTARNAGLPCLSVSWGFRDSEFLAQNGATTIVNTTDELLALL